MKICYHCNGLGERYEHICRVCQGRGMIKEGEDHDKERGNQDYFERQKALYIHSKLRDRIL